MGLHRSLEQNRRLVGGKPHLDQSPGINHHFIKGATCNDDTEGLKWVLQSQFTILERVHLPPSFPDSKPDNDNDNDNDNDSDNDKRQRVLRCELMRSCVYIYIHTCTFSTHVSVLRRQLQDVPVFQRGSGRGAFSKSRSGRI